MPRSTFETRLAASRAVVAALRSAGPQSMPMHHADQLTAAARDAHRLSVILGEVAAALEPERQWRDATIPESSVAAEEISARVYAAVAGCDLCHHLRRGSPQPAWARLPLRRLDCNRCAATFRHPPSGEDDVCDWCHRAGVDEFTAVALQVGPLIALGDACDRCAAALLEAAA